MLITFRGKTPALGTDVFVAPTAVIVGDVRIDNGSSIWFNAVVRGDLSPVTIGAGTNIQDNCTLHTDPGLPLSIGGGVTVGHNAVIHSCTIEDHVLIGMNATVLNGAVIRRSSVVAAGSVVKEGQNVGPNHLVAGIPADLKRDFKGEMYQEILEAAESYRQLAQKYLSIQPKPHECVNR